MGEPERYPDPRRGPWSGFALAAAAAVEHLDARLGLDLWLVTAVRGADQEVIASAGPWAALAAPGTLFSWADSFCLRMVDRQGPTVAPDVRAVPAYAAAATGVLSRVRAYVGVPLEGDDGVVFGTLCAFAGDAQPDTLADSLDVVELVGRMLSTILAREQFARDRSAEAAQAHALAGEDAVTGLRNRRGWLAALEQEHQRCQRYGSTPSVLSVQLHTPDRLVEGAEVLRASGRPGDLVARVGGEEFGVLAVECAGPHSRALLTRLRIGLRTAGLTATAGAATRRTGEALEATWERARAERERDARRRLAAVEGQAR